MFCFFFCFTDASSSNEAVHLQQCLRSLSTELSTLRNRLHVSQPGDNSVTGSQNGGSGVDGSGSGGGGDNSGCTSNPIMTGGVLTSNHEKTQTTTIITTTTTIPTATTISTTTTTSLAPAVPPRTTLAHNSSTLSHGIGHTSGHSITASAVIHQHVNHNTTNDFTHNSTTTNNLISGTLITLAINFIFLISRRSRNFIGN